MDDDHGQAARENAVSFEAVKTSMSQSKTGTILRLAIHPNEVPPSLHTDWVGTRYTVAMVALNDDDTPRVDEQKLHIDRLIQSAGMLCRNDEFQSFVGAVDEESCVEILREIMGVKSRSEMRTNEDARNAFEKLRNQFSMMKSGRA